MSIIKMNKEGDEIEKERERKQKIINKFYWKKYK